MKQFEIKALNKKLMIAIGLPIFIVYLIGVITYVINEVEGENSLVLTAILALIPIFIILAILTRLCKKNYTVDLSDTQITLRQNGLVKKSIFYKDIMFIRQFGVNQVRNIIVFSKGNTKPDIELLQVLKSNDKMDEILNTLLKSGSYVKTQREQNNQLWTEFLNKEMIDSQASVISALKSNKTNSKKQIKVIAITFGILMFITLAFGGFAIYKNKSKGYYTYSYDAVYYGDQKLNINPKEVKRLSYNVIKDSSNVFYDGQILQWADCATFECLEAPFYYDKNGVYYETSNFLSDNQIKPLDGNYDQATFKYVGRFYYKDKENLYKLKIDVVNLSDNPLDKISVKGLDLGSFELVNKMSFYWFKDKNKVYFSSDKKLKPTDGLDTETFEVLTFNVAKDKNHVYYITNNLKSEGKSATDYADYAILEGADAPTFRMIDYNNFEDKNTTWVIEK